jgi:hypothetical protein
VPKEELTHVVDRIKALTPRAAIKVMDLLLSKMSKAKAIADFLVGDSRPADPEGRLQQPQELMQSLESISARRWRLTDFGALSTRGHTRRRIHHRWRRGSGHPRRHPRDT